MVNENDRVLSVKESLGAEIAKLKGVKFTRNTTETYHVEKERASRQFHRLLQLPVG